MTRRFLPVVALLLSPALLLAQAPAMKAEPVDAPDRQKIEIGPVAKDTEQWERYWGQTMVRNVNRPAIYPVYPDAAKRNGQAVIVVPGGGYNFVSIDSEGFRVADALAEAGFVALILKYRPRETPRDPAAYMAMLAEQFGTLGKGTLPDHPPAVDDLAQAIDYARQNAGDLAIDPAKIGVIGFSAGARTLIRLIEQKPQAERVSNYALMYPPMVQTIGEGPRHPLFLAIAVDDPLFQQGGLNMLESWLGESDDVEFHLYSGGSHGFGMRDTGTTSGRWIGQYIAWLNWQFKPTEAASRQ